MSIHVRPTDRREFIRFFESRNMDVKSVDFYDDHPEEGERFRITLDDGRVFLGWFKETGLPAFRSMARV